MFDPNPSLLDPSEHKFFSEFLDGLMESPTSDQIDTSLKRNIKLQDPRLQNMQIKGYAALGLAHDASKVQKKRGPGRPKKVDRDLENSKTDESAKRGYRRDLLTENEKRQNHVVSEQKRRAMIKDGFQRLIDLTPSLSDSPPVSTGPGNTGGTHSKSTVLFKAAEYIFQLKQQVAMLERQIESSSVSLALSDQVVQETTPGQRIEKSITHDAIVGDLKMPKNLNLGNSNENKFFRQNVINYDQKMGESHRWLYQFG